MAADGRAAGEARGAREARDGLFGRGLLYVVVWAVQMLGSTLVSPVLTHLLPPAQFGALASAIALHQLLIVLAVAGLDQAITVRHARDDDVGTARVLVTAGTLLACGVTLVTWLTAPLWGGAAGFGSAPGVLLPALLWTAPGAGVQLALVLLMSQDRFRAFAAVSGLSTAGGQGLGIALLLAGNGQAGVYAWGGVISQVCAMVLGFALVRPRAVRREDRPQIAAALALGVPLMLGGLSAFVLNAGDRLVVAGLIGSAEVGRYQVAYTVGNVVVLMTVFIRQSWTPRILAVRDPQERWALIGRSRDSLLVLLIPAFLAVVLAAPMLLRVVAPASFRPLELTFVVCLVALCAFPVGAAGASGSGLLSAGRTRPLAIASALAAVVNVLLNLVLVPRVGITGAAAATLAAFTLQAWLQRRWLGGGLPRAAARATRTPLPLLAAVALAAGAGAAVTRLPDGGPGWTAARAVGCAACAGWALLLLQDEQTGTATPRRARRRSTLRMPWRRDRSDRRDRRDRRGQDPAPRRMPARTG